MAHYYQKKWVFTWNIGESGLLVDEKKLQNLLNEIVEEGVFQKERGETTGRLHYQGRFKLKGPRTGKKQLLKLFSELACVRNLTFEPERSKDSTRYCSKVQTRIDGPWFVGTPRYRRNNTPITISLRRWQEQLLNELNGPLAETLRERSVVWVQDPLGGSGKSTFLRYLRFGQTNLTVRKLPFDRPDRLRMFVCKVAEETDIDLFAFDFTRTLDEDTSVKSLFQVIEELKNGYIVSAMFGRPLEVLIDSPFVLILTNEDISSYFHYLCMDRWCCYEIRNAELLKIRKTPGFSPHDLNSRYIKLNEKEKKV